MKTKSIITAFALAASVAAYGQQPKYIFYYIGDGMGVSPVMAAMNYNRIVRGNAEPLNLSKMETEGWVQSWSASSDRTDSAAAGTALACGTKTNNAMLGMTPDTVAVESIASKLHNMGYGVALATSVSPDDATPAAFFTHVPNRGMLYEIDCDIAACGYEFIAGAGIRGTKTDHKPNDVYDKLAKAGVQIIKGQDQIKDINSRRVLMLNPEGVGQPWDISYTIDSVPGALTLPVIAQAALDHMQKVSPDSFFIMIEGGNIDHALHGNEAGTAIKEILNFDQALGVAYDFYLAHPDETLIVVTADHDTGGLAIVRQRGGKGGLANIDYQKVSKETFSDFCKSLLKSKNAFTWPEMKEYMAENLGFFTHIPVSSKDEKALKKIFDDTFEHRNTSDQETLYANFNAFAVKVFDMFNEAAGIHFGTTSHSGNPVPVFATGCGSDHFKGVKDNTDLPKAIMKAMGQEL